MPNQVDLSAVDPIVDDRLDALEAGDGGGPGGIGQWVDYANYGLALTLDHSIGVVAVVSDDYAPGDASPWSPVEGNLVPVMTTSGGNDGGFDFPDGGTAMVYLWAQASFVTAPTDGRYALYVQSIGGETLSNGASAPDGNAVTLASTPPGDPTMGTGDGVATSLTAQASFQVFVPVGGHIGPMGIHAYEETDDVTVTAVEMSITLLS